MSGYREVGETYGHKEIYRKEVPVDEEVKYLITLNYLKEVTKIDWVNKTEYYNAYHILKVERLTKKRFLGLFVYWKCELISKGIHSPTTDFSIKSYHDYAISTIREHSKRTGDKVIEWTN